MQEKIKELIQNKNILILGYGREGKETYKLFRKLCPDQQFTIADSDEKVRINNEELQLDIYLNFILGNQYLMSLDDFDLIVKSPGISLKDIPYSINYKKITSQTDLFLKIYSNQVVGITGTKGKSTTTSLIYHILKTAKTDTLLVGNIGIPPFSIIDSVTENTIIVCELSSHQLEYLSVAPHISVLLNIYEEHLDHYKSYKEYQKAKLNIFKFQKKNDFAIYNNDDVLIKEHLSKNDYNQNFYSFSIKNNNSKGCSLINERIIFSDENGSNGFCSISDIQNLKGKHNILNVMAAICASKIIGINKEQIIESIRTFKGLEHRIEYVGMYDGIHFYNDSISTIPQATIQAVEALENVNTLILGGFDRGINYNEFIQFLITSTVENLVFIADAGKRMLDIYNSVSGQNDSQKTYFVTSLEDAVNIAKQKTKKNSCCLLSPAAASYGMFKNFEDRGTQFKKLVKNLG